MIDEMVANKINENEAKINNDTEMKVEKHKGRKEGTPSSWSDSSE